MYTTIKKTNNEKCIHFKHYYHHASIMKIIVYRGRMKDKKNRFYLEFLRKIGRSLENNLFFIVRNDKKKNRLFCFLFFYSKENITTHFLSEGFRFFLFLHL